TSLPCCIFIFFSFFFQAEDGIRDFHVTGVQTCALPIFDVNSAAVNHYGYTREEFLSMTVMDIRPLEEIPKLKAAVAQSRRRSKRSEERRVGKECRSRWWRYQ